MAVYDLWHRRVNGRKVRTGLYGTGKRWQARWRDGRDVQRKRNFDTKDAAEAFLARERLTPAQQVARTTVAAQYVLWIAAKGSVRESTRADYRQKWRLHVEPRWGDLLLSQVRHSDVAAWVGEVAEATSGSTARRAFMVLSGVIRSAVRDGVLVADPTAGIDLPKQARADVRPLTVEQLRAVAAACTPHDLVVWTLGLTGMRFGEMAGLRVGDLDPGRRRLRVSRSLSELNGKLTESLPKNGRARDVSVPPWLMDRLAGAAEGRGSAEPLLPTQHGRVWRSGTWKRIWLEARKAAKVPTARVHDLRHTAATLAIQSGANVKAVQAMLGHQSAAMTLDLYAHFWDDGLDDVAGRMGALVEDPPEPDVP